MRTKILPLLLVAFGWAAALPGAQIPRKSPEFVIQLPGGKQAIVSDYKGKVLCLAFILSTCPHCQHAIDVINGMYPELAAQGFRMVAATLDQGSDPAQFSRDHQTKFPIGWAEQTTVLDFVQIPVTARAFVPFLVFIDKQGIIQAQYTGGDLGFFSDKLAANFKAQVDKLLKGAAPPEKSKPALPAHKPA